MINVIIIIMVTFGKINSQILNVKAYKDLVVLGIWKALKQAKIAAITADWSSKYVCSLYVHNYINYYSYIFNYH